MSSDAPDVTTERLRALQKPLTRHLWVPADAITFTPHVLTEVYGDGRALFRIVTMNSRPAYWIVRGCSTWSCENYRAPSGSPEFGDFSDEIMSDLENEFGRAECGETYEWDGDRILDLDQQANDGDILTEADISYPVVNYGNGCAWGRLDWPDEIGEAMAPHPFDPSYRILAESINAEADGIAPAARLLQPAKETP